MFTLISKEIEDYCEKYSSPQDPVLYQLYRETNLKVIHPRMLSGQLQGLLLEMISRLVMPKYILELGTFTGYATICLSKGLAENGLIYTIDNDPELSELSQKYFEKANITHNVKSLTGDAIDIIPTLNHSWDLIFIDADKRNYLNYYELLLPKLSQNGILIADNVLWSGKILTDVKANDKETQALMAFNEHVRNDNRVNNLLLPFRDGLMMVQKK